ncbi:MAG: GNAT family N-acetyltransferase [Fusobacteriaceae bacterium]
MEIVIKKFEELSAMELYEILKVRSEVFVVEQNCPYLDPDGKDLTSEHIIVRENLEIIAYARILKPGVSYDESSIGRVLTVEKARGRGLGKELIQKAVQHITMVWNEKKIRISGQAYLLDFYKNLGFNSVSEIYLEDDIPHIEMVYEKDRK